MSKKPSEIHALLTPINRLLPIMFSDGMLTALEGRCPCGDHLDDFRGRLIRSDEEVTIHGMGFCTACVSWVNVNVTVASVDGEFVLVPTTRDQSNPFGISDEYRRSITRPNKSMGNTIEEDTDHDRGRMFKKMSRFFS